MGTKYIEKKIESPCNNICRLNKDGMCVGCFRMIDEISNWFMLTPEEKAAVIRKAYIRLQLGENDSLVQRV